MRLSEEVSEQFKAKLAISEVDFGSILIESKRNVMEFVSLCIKRNLMTRYDMGMLLGDSFNCAYVDLEKTLFQVDVVNLLPKAIAEKYQAIPIYQFGSAITLVIADPRDSEAKKEISSSLLYFYFKRLFHFANLKAPASL